MAEKLIVVLARHDFLHCYFKIEHVCHGVSSFISSVQRNLEQNRAVIFGHLLDRSTPATVAAGHTNETEGRIITIRAG